ncbi:MAG: flavin reductase family protein [Actinocatenispora sp.]
MARNSGLSDELARFVVDCDSGTSGLEAQAFRSIMSSFPSGVVVVTTVDESGVPVGMTCSATCSVSQNPPMLLVCIDSRSTVLRAMLARGQFVVNFLRGDGERISRVFASTGRDRFGSVAWQPSRLGGLPWMPLDTIAYAECEVAAAVEAGDHTVVFGALMDGQAEGGRLSPLMYWRRRYGRWPVEADDATTLMTLAAEG